MASRLLEEAQPLVSVTQLRIHWLSVVILCFVHGCCIFFLGRKVSHLASTHEGHVIKIPSTIQDAKEIKDTAIFLTTNHSILTTSLFSLLYLFKQTYAIPGSVVLNIIAGMLWGVKVGWPMVCVLSASGATLCFMLSWLVAEDFVRQADEDAEGTFLRRLAAVRSKCETVQKEDGSLTMLLYLTSLRLFPATPNWLLNLVLPHCGVNLKMFFLSVLFGLLPYNFITVSAGTMLSSVESTRDIFDTATVVKFVFAALLLAGFAPALKYLSKRLEKESEKSQE